MSPFSVEALANEPIIVVTLNEDFNVAEHISKSDTATREILATNSQAYFNIIDTTRWKFNFDQLIQGANTGARGEDPIWKHPQIRQTILVTENQAIVMVAKGLRSATFGNIDVQVTRTLEEALAWCREQLSESPTP